MQRKKNEEAQVTPKRLGEGRRMVLVAKGTDGSPIKAEQTNRAYLCPALKTTKQRP